MSNCDRCGLKRKTQNMSCFAKVLDGCPDMKDKNLCSACKNHVLHVSACTQMKKPVCRPDYQYMTDKRYKHDITKISEP